MFFVLFLFGFLRYFTNTNDTINKHKRPAIINIDNVINSLEIIGGKP